jgi:hypothetical protein
MQKKIIVILLICFKMGFSQEKSTNKIEVETNIVDLPNLSLSYLYSYQSQLGIAIGAPRLNYYFKRNQPVIEPFFKTFFSEKKQNRGLFYGVSLPIGENEHNNNWSINTTLLFGYKWVFNHGWTITYQGECTINLQTEETTTNIIGLQIGKRFILK